MQVHQLEKSIKEISIFLKPEIYMQEILKALCSYLQYDFGVVFTKHDATGIEVVSSYCVPGGYFKILKKVDINSPRPLSSAMDTGNTICIADVYSEQALTQCIEDFTTLGIRSAVYVPLSSEGKSFGVYALYSSVIRNLTPQELTALRQIGSILSIAIAANKYVDSLYQRTVQLEQEVNLRRQVEYLLKDSEERFRSIFEGAPIGIALINPLGQIADTNKSLQKTLGYSEEELRNKRLNDIIEPGADDIVLDQKLIEEANNKYHIEKCFVSKSGNIINGKLNLSVVHTDTSKFFIGMLEDITARRKIEEELLKAHKLESLGVLAGGIAHDFNNLLTVMLGNISLSKLNLHSPERAKQFISEAETAGIQAKNLTQQLLTFSKGGSWSVRTISIEKLIREAAQFTTMGSNVHYELDFEQSLNKVKVDEGQINQVLNNILINARQAMSNGGLIRISGRNIQLKRANTSLPLPKGNYVVVKIEDNGCGIPKEIMTKIFDPYFTTKDYGNGLGLAIAYSIMKKHKGFISVSSIPEKGTVFELYFPTAEGNGESQGIVQPQLVRGRGKVLVMDDEANIRNTIGSMLEELGYTTEYAANGQEAIELFVFAKQSGSPFDLVILDLIVRDGMGGKETIHKLRKLDSKVKAIVSSGYSDDLVLSEFQQHGFDYFLPKPFNTYDLSRVLEKVLLPESWEAGAM